MQLLLQNGAQHATQRSGPKILASQSGTGADRALDEAAKTLTAYFQQDQVSDIAQMTLLNRLGHFSYAQAGIERLKNTPLPFVYSLLIHRTVFIYCALLPFAMFSEAGWFSPILTAVLVYVCLGLAAVTDCLENPFSQSEHAVPVKAMEAVCLRKLETALRRPEITPLIEVEDFVLR